VVVRDENGELRAYHNFCRHRGHPLCTERHGKLRTSKIVCPYHGWTYSTSDGSCQSAVLMPEDFDKSRYGLFPAQVADNEGFIFVTFADEPQPLPDLAGVGFRGYDTRRIKVVARKTWETKANWHIVSENNMECYHCALNHPSLLRVHDPMDDYIDDDHLAPAFTDPSHEPMLVWGTTMRRASSYTIDNRSVCRMPMPRTDETPARVRQVGMHPGAFIVLGPDAGFITSWRPISVKHTRQEIRWVIHEDASPEDYDEGLLTELLSVTQDEDEALAEQVQRGVEAPRFTPGPMNRNFQAGGILHYMWVAWHMGEGALAQ
jgi:Rieske 2Fe-2S family protein